MINFNLRIPTRPYGYIEFTGSGEYENSREELNKLKGFVQSANSIFGEEQFPEEKEPKPVPIFKDDDGIPWDEPPPPQEEENPTRKRDLSNVKCPLCSSDCWDNRLKKLRPTSADFQCKNKECNKKAYVDHKTNNLTWWEPKK